MTANQIAKSTARQTGTAVVSNRPGRFVFASKGPGSKPGYAAQEFLADLEFVGMRGHLEPLSHGVVILDK